ncbi:MAG: DUF3786 domain-containing protein [Nitrososphaerota archaeon]|nr:DUF3786 domain-containing protein [Nitrososphaerota archaeon]
MIPLNLDKQTLTRLRHLTGTVHYQFLGFTINLEDCAIIDNFNSSAQNLTDVLAVRLIAPLLSHYAMGKPSPLTGRLIKFKDLPGGYAYEGAFINRAVKPLEWVFGDSPALLSDAAELLGGRRMSLGDVSAEISVLRYLPLTFILYVSDEFGASANILYDESAASFLPTEDLAVLGELTVLRIIAAKEMVLKKRFLF